MGTISGREQPLSEEMIDATLADSFPASDPPSWTQGRDRYRGQEPDFRVLETPESRTCVGGQLPPAALFLCKDAEA